MNDLPVATIDERKGKNSFSGSVTSADLGDSVPCAEGEELKHQYDSARHEWKMRSLPQVSPFPQGEAGAGELFSSEKKH